MGDWQFAFTAEGADDPEKPVTFLCSGYMEAGEALAELQKQASAFAEQGRDIVLDLARVTGLGSTGIGALASIVVKTAKEGHTGVLRNPKPNVTRLLKMIGFSAYLKTEAPVTQSDSSPGAGGS